MNRSEFIFSVLLVPLDYLAVVLAGLSAYSFRFSILTQFRPALYEIPLQEFLNLVLAVGVIWVVAVAATGLYTTRSTQRFLSEFGRIVIAASAAVMVVIILIFIQRELFSSRFIIILGWGLVIVYATILRLIVRRIQRSFLRRGVGTHRVVLVGSGSSTDALQAYLSGHPEAGYAVVAVLPGFVDEHRQQLQEVVTHQAVDEIIQSDSQLTRDERMSILRFCEQHHLDFSYAANLFETRMANVSLTTLAGIPIVGIKRTQLIGWGRVWKRTFDLVASFLLLILLSPLLFVLAVLVLIDSGRPVLVRLSRVGRGGKQFRVLKFRSMIQGAHALKPQLAAYNERKDGPLFKMKDDPRITRIGKFLRASSLDELPQLFNVFLGRMSLVGPRPHEPEEVAQYTHDQKKLLTIKPGVTGLAQISGRSDLSFRDEARLDTYYIENWSLWLDLQLLLKTPLALVRKRSAA